MHPKAPTPEYIRILRTHLAERQRKNPAYSMRSYARDLALASGTLVSILKGRRGVPKKTVKSLCTKLRLSPQESQGFILSMGNRGRLRDLAKKTVQAGEPTTLDSNLDESFFRVLAHWEHFAILSLMETRDWRSDPKWIAERLGISSEVTQDCIDRLLECGLIGYSKSGRLEKRFSRITTPEDVKSIAIQKSHIESFKLAETKLLEVDPSLRDFSSITMAIDRRLLPEAKALLREFRQKLSALLESGESRDVYRLCIQLFPLTQLDDKEARQKGHV